jgi:VanZ family protein
MKSSSPSLKNRRASVYIFFALYLFSAVFWLAQSAVPADASGSFSTAVGNTIAWFMNLFEDTTPATKLEPKALALKSDSTVLNKFDTSLSKPSLAVGTTTMLQFAVSFDEVKNTYKDPTFTVERNDDSTADLYTYTIDVSQQVVRIVSVGEAKKDCSILVKAGTSLSYAYSFDIVELPAPTAYETNLRKSALKINESTQIGLALKNPENQTIFTPDSALNETKKAEATDAYFRRYFDPTKLAFSSSDETIASIDKNGVIVGHKEGETSIKYGTLEQKITVSSASYQKPVSPSSITLKKDDPNDSLAIFDYATEGAGVRLSATPSWDSTLSDQGIHWQVDDPLKARIYSASGLSCLVQGYRKKGTVTVSAISNVNNAIVGTIELPIEEIQPDRMSLSLKVGTQVSALPATYSSNKGLAVTILGSLTSTKSTNVTNTNLVAVASNDLIKVTGSGSSIIGVTFVGVGDSSVTIASEGNPSLKQSIAFSVAAEINQDPSDTKYQLSVRKVVGHALGSALIAIFGFIFFHLFFADFSKDWLSSLFVVASGLAISGLSEIIQLIPALHRGASIVDVGIDMIGVVAAVLLLYGLYALIYFLKKKKTPSEPSESK